MVAKRTFLAETGLSAPLVPAPSVLETAIETSTTAAIDAPVAIPDRVALSDGPSNT